MQQAADREGITLEAVLQQLLAEAERNCVDSEDWPTLVRLADDVFLRVGRREFDESLTQEEIDEIRGAA